VILLCGIPSETPLQMVREQLDRLGAAHLVFNQREFDKVDMELAIAGGRIEGYLRLQGRTYPLREFTGLYMRLMDDRFLPELAAEPMDSERRRHCRDLHQYLVDWADIAPANIVNRTAPMASNFSKPYQAQMIQAHGFAVPETLITTEPGLVRDFCARHARVIYKSISGVRSIVKTMCDEDLERLDTISWCPVQFQAYVEGLDVRVHVVDQEVFATAVHSSATDYRYAHTQTGQPARLEALALPEELAAACVDLTRSIGLAFSGIDLKLEPDGRVTCFEVNPCPAFSYYEASTGQPIATAVARYLGRT
jgi:hypothetical protein